MAQFTEHAFFGGAIRGVVPQGWIDGSTLREVPDHQELFLSPRTLSSLIVEINQRVSRADALSVFSLPNLAHQQPPPSGSTASSETVDQAAALYHLHDLCDEGDTMQVISAPTRVSLPHLSSSSSAAAAAAAAAAAVAATAGGISAYKGVVSFTTTERQRPGGRLPSSVDGSAASATSSDNVSALGGATVNGGTDLPQTSRLTCHYLLVRLEAQDTDLLVFLNVPHREFDTAGDARGLSREEVDAEETIGALAQRLEVCDWGLFV